MYSLIWLAALVGFGVIATLYVPKRSGHIALGWVVLACALFRPFVYLHMAISHEIGSSIMQNVTGWRDSF